MVTSSDLQSKFENLSKKLLHSVKLNHLLTLTDNSALLQHSKFSIPARKEGYAVDDNARALVFAVKGRTLWPSNSLRSLQGKLMSFLLLMQSEDGRFHNLMDFSHRIIDEPTVGDHLGRVLWAAGAVINSNLPNGVKSSAKVMFDRALPWALQSSWPRTKAYSCLGLAERLRADSGDNNLRSNLRKVADSLVELYETNRANGWEWFEQTLTYDNARLCQGLLGAYESLGDRKYLNAGERTLHFLAKATTINETYVPIGSHGWYRKGGERAIYDQQPIEAGAMVETMTLAYNLIRSEKYEKTLRHAIGWFFGKNTKNVKVYDELTGACYDGVNAAGLNENQGAESTLAFLLAAQKFIETFRG